jgi:hypothetical protein
MLFRECMLQITIRRRLKKMSWSLMHSLALVFDARRRGTRLKNTLRRKAASLLQLVEPEIWHVIIVARQNTSTRISGSMRITSTNALITTNLCQMSEEQGQANIDKGSQVKYLSLGMTFPTDQLMLTDPNIWIADTMATVHTMPYENGMSESKQADTEDSIIVSEANEQRAGLEDC